MSKVNFKLNLPGLNQIMKSAEMKSELTRYGQQVASRAGDGYESETVEADFVALARISPANYEAVRDNEENNTLLKSL